MPMLGEFQYPTVGAEELMKYAKALGANGARILDRAELASILGLEGKKRGLGTIVSDLETYGLLVADGKRIKKTPFVRRLARSAPGRRLSVSLLLALWRVPLLNLLARYLQGRIPAKGTSYVAILSALTRVHVKRVGEHEASIAKIYEGFMERIGVMRIPKRAGRD